MYENIFKVFSFVKKKPQNLFPNFQENWFSLLWRKHFAVIYIFCGFPAVKEALPWKINMTNMENTSHRLFL